MLRPVDVGLPTKEDRTKPGARKREVRQGVKLARKLVPPWGAREFSPELANRLSHSRSLALRQVSLPLRLGVVRDCGGRVQEFSSALVVGDDSVNDCREDGLRSICENWSLCQGSVKRAHLLHADFENGTRVNAWPNLGLESSLRFCLPSCQTSSTKRGKALLPDAHEGGDTLVSLLLGEPRTLRGRAAIAQRIQAPSHSGKVVGAESRA